MSEFGKQGEKFGFGMVEVAEWMRKWLWLWVCASVQFASRSNGGRGGGRGDGMAGLRYEGTRKQ